ncbi:MAG: 1-deoxy-D-xylulose-5-phosphate synthase [Planctomycetota bacterium]|nr:MAG: 1-deoxy-D-xylulose-5-phosphate synthase [Planctomycetota bacterium]
MADPAPAAPQLPLLDKIHGPADLKALGAAELPELCRQMREFLLHSVQQTGGHLGSNLGVVELTVALHRVFDFKRDRVVWDVGHQCYPHKILTGRRDGFARLRMTEGLCGFPHPRESEYDLFHTGHAGTSIALALGLAYGGAHEPDPPRAVAVIGDASLGAGVAFEALNNAGASGQRLLVVLNDNEWSISRSVGALARYLTRIRSARVLQRAGQEIHGLLQSIPLVGDKLDRRLDEVREVLRHAVVQGHVFEELGVTYVGPLDGHDVGYLIENLERVKRLEGVVLMHCLTEKGKGHPKAPSHPERVHGVKGAAKATPAPTAAAVPHKLESARTEAGKLERVAAPAVPSGPAYTNAFAQALIKLAERDLRVHALTAGMPSGTGLDAYAERFPTRFHDTGITEQHAVAMAAGMAKAGLRPVVAIYSTFLQRAYDQVFQEVALQDLPVLFALDRGGLVGQDGPTHNGVFDIAYLRTLPNFVLAAPRDQTDLERMLALGLASKGPFAVRWPRDNCPGRERIPALERRVLEPGTAEVVLEGGEIVIWAYGALVNQALAAAELLRERGVDVGVVDARFAKPLDEELLGRQLSSARWIVTVEEHQRAGGFGSAVLEAASRSLNARARVKVLAIPDRYLEHMSTREEQLASVELDADGIASAVGALVRARVT